MTSADIALVCGLNFHVGCQDRRGVNSNADVTIVNGTAEASKVLAYNHFIFLYSADVPFKFISRNHNFSFFVISRFKVNFMIVGC